MLRRANTGRIRVLFDAPADADKSLIDYGVSPARAKA
jgi:hypothetical protein